MAHQTVVRYTTRDAAASAENHRLIEGVFAELASVHPDGLRYTVSRLDDGLSYVHVAVVDGPANPLTALESFRAFSSTIGERASQPPTSVTSEVIASFG
jgi:hypothetical protein